VADVRFGLEREWHAARSGQRMLSACTAARLWRLAAARGELHSNPNGKSEFR
jgi:hypothetical protein